MRVCGRNFDKKTKKLLPSAVKVALSGSLFQKTTSLMFFLAETFTSDRNDNAIQKNLLYTYCHKKKKIDEIFCQSCKKGKKTYIVEFMTTKL